MPRFYIPPGQWQLDHLTLDPAETHHCLDVLRMQVGDRAAVFDGCGQEATVEIATAAKGRVAFNVLQHAKTPALACEIILAQSIPKGRNMDLIIEKATELGAAAIIPLLSERSVILLGGSEALDKRDKWQRVAIEAAKQCGRNWLPQVAPPITPRALFDSRPAADLLLIASLQPGAQHLKTILRDAGPSPRRVLILVGPEGDFTPAEVALALSAGCHPLTLGPIILRTETAAIYCLSVLSHELFASA